MGNKWNNSLEIISPVEYPYLHIEKRRGLWEYVPSVGNSGRLIVYQTLDTNDLLGSDKAAEVSFQMLPPIDHVPPTPVSVSAQTREFMNRLFDTNSTAVELINRHRDANAIAIEHGRVWGTLPVEILREKLLKLGIKTEDGMSALGRGKRYAQHALRLKTL